MSIYSTAIKTALRLIKRYGEAVTWVVEGTPTADGATPWITSDGAETSFSVSILYTSHSDNPLAKLLPGTEIETGELQGLMPAVNFTPKVDDTVIRSNGTKLAIQSVRPLAPSGETILWFLVFKS